MHLFIPPRALDRSRHLTQSESFASNHDLKMQGGISTCAYDENIFDIEGAPSVDEDYTIKADAEGVAEIIRGYGECMAEALRYLIEVENYPKHHPAVNALECHLSQYKQRLLRSAIYQSSEVHSLDHRQ